MKKIALLLSLLLCLCGSLLAQTIAWANAVPIPANTNESMGVTHDDSGNVYYTGYFRGTCDFDPSASVFNMTAIGSSATYILKLDSAGNFVWAKSVGNVVGWSSGACQGYTIAIDKTGNVVVGGTFYATVDFDPGAATYLLSSSIYTTSSGFILKLDLNGNFIWAKQLYGKDAAVYSLHIDDHNNIVSTGHFNDTTDFDPGTATYNLVTAGGEEIFVLKLDAAGNFIWAKRTGGVYDDFGYRITTDHAGNVYTTGYFKDTSDFDPGAGTYKLITSYFYEQIFVWKLDSSGNFVWARQMGGNSGDDAGNGIVVDNSANVYTTGYFRGTGDFDPGSGTYNLTGDAIMKSMFVSKLDNAGNFVWVKKYNSPLGDCFGQSMAIDSFSNLLITGGFSDSVDFDPGPATHFLKADINYTDDLFITKLDQSGNFGWAIQAGGEDLDFGSAIDCNRNGAIYVTGLISDTIDFDPTSGVYWVDAVAHSMQVFNATYHYCPLPQPSVVITAHPGLTIIAGQRDTLVATVSGGSGTTTFQWYVNGIAISGAVTPTYITDSLTDNDTVKCAVTTGPPCGGAANVSTSGYVVVHVGSGIAQQNNAITINLWPNPNDGIFHISGIIPSGTDEVSICIYDALGRKVYTGMVPVNASRINAPLRLSPNLSDGIYVLEIVSKTDRSYSRFQLQRL